MSESKNIKMLCTSIAWFLIFDISGCTVELHDQYDYIFSHVSLGMTYLQQGDRQKARLILNEALLRNPSSPTVLDAMAYLEESSGNIVRASNYYEQAIDQAPRVGDWHNNYGAFLCRHNQEPAGIQEFLRAARSENYLFAGNAFENAGLCALNMNDKVKAKVFFSQALENDPQLKLSRDKLKEINFNN